MTIRVNRAPGRLLTAVAAVSLGHLLVANALGADGWSAYAGCVAIWTRSRTSAAFS